LDLHNLLGGRANKRSQAFPRFLPQQTQARARLDGALHRFIRRKSLKDFANVDVQLKVMPEPIPILHRRGCFHEDAVLFLAQADPASGHHAFPRAINAAPAKSLPGSERGRQIVILRRKFCHAGFPVLNRNRNLNTNP